MKNKSEKERKGEEEDEENSSSGEVDTQNQFVLRSIALTF